MKNNIWHKNPKGPQINSLYCSPNFDRHKTNKSEIPYLMMMIIEFQISTKITSLIEVWPSIVCGCIGLMCKVVSEEKLFLGLQKIFWIFWQSECNFDSGSMLNFKDSNFVHNHKRNSPFDSNWHIGFIDF